MGVDTVHDHEKTRWEREAEEVEQTKEEDKAEKEAAVKEEADKAEKEAAVKEEADKQAIRSSRVLVGGVKTTGGSSSPGTAMLDQ